MTEYLNDFVQESEESITELNNALLDLERNPEDGETMDEVFRTAHTLKGNAGAMGFDDASDLAHALEDLLDAIRAGSLEITPELMDEVFEAVDVLDRMIDEVGEEGATRTDPTEQIEALRDLIEESTGLTKPLTAELERTVEGGRRPRRQHEVFHTRLSVLEGEDAGVVVDALNDAFDLLSTDPDEGAIREGDHDGIIDVAFGSVVDEAAIAAALEPVDAVEDAIITEVPPDVIDKALDESAERSSAETDDGADPDVDVDADDMAVDELLDEFTEYDDLDEAVERVDDVEGLENMGEAGAFDDIVEEDVTPSHEPDDETAETEAEQSRTTEATAAEDSQEVEDVEGTFNELQEEYDRVGLDQMEDELEGVSFGEYDEEDEVGFDELLGDDLEADEPAEADPEETEPAAAEPAEEEPAAPTIEQPDEAAIEAAVDDATAPSEPGRGVFVVRLAVADGEDVNNGPRVIEALRDAFDLLGTRPDEVTIDEGEYRGWFDAVFGSDVDKSQVESALAPVDEVADAIVLEVTDRMPDPATAEETAAEPADDEAAGDDELVAEEPDDPQEAFATLQDEYDQVGLDQMEDELEGVSFGEYDEQEEVGFDELLGDDLEADEPAEAEPTPSAPEIEDPDDGAIERAVNSAALPSDPGREVFVVRLAVVEEPDVNNGIRVIEALRDAFDLLGTVPTETDIGEGDYEGWFDAVFGSDVGESQVESALAPVDEVADAIVLEVTDRMPDPATAEETAAEPADDDAATAEPAAAEPADSEAAGDADVPVPEEPDDPQEAFATLQDEYDQVGLDQMEDELEGVSFGEYDEQEEVGFDELLGDDLEADEPAEAEADAGEAEGDAPATGTGDAGGEFDEAEAGGEFGEAEASDEFGEVEAGDEFGEVEAGDEFGEVEASDEFGEVEPGEGSFEEAEGELGGTAEGFDEGDVEVEEISVDDEADFADVDVDEVEAGEAEFGEVEADEADDEFGDVEVGSGSDFGDVEPMDPGTDVTRDLPDEAENPVNSIKGIGDSYASSLADAGIETVADLVTADPGELSGKTDISAGRIEEWNDRAPISASAVESAAEASAAEKEPAESQETAEPAEPTTERQMDEIQSVRVDVDRVDELLNLVEEMVTSRARLRRAVQDDAPMDVLEDELDELDVTTSQLQDQVMEMRLVPVETVTQRLPRVVRDIARDQGKRVRFEAEGEDVEVDRSILNEIGDALIHLVRNAIDHGIESPEKREAAGKDSEGTITLAASRSRDTVTLEIRDDGRGLDADDLRSKAVEEGILSETEAEQLSDADAYDLVFRSGFSTREEVTDVSGRGVGMDVVANTVDDLDGQVTVDSEPGGGTTVGMTLPVSVAISEVVFLKIGGEEYGVPIKVVDEISSMSVAETVRQNGSEAVVTDDGTEKELVRLHEALDTPEPERTRTGGMLVTIEDDVRSIAIQCDDVLAQQEVVVKPYEGLLSDIPGLSGAATLGEGAVINIIDVETL
jgi:two-component system chemotaxis sensor kinase CheA